MLFIFAFLLIVILVVLVRCIVIVPQSNAYVTEWLGVYKDTWGAGLHIRTPFCLLYTSPSPRDLGESRMPSSA